MFNANLPKSQERIENLIYSERIISNVMTTKTDEYDWDFFIAHASADKASAETLYALLEPKSRVFLASRDILPGTPWIKEVLEAQQSSRITIVLISSNTEEAYYENEEILAAIDLARKKEKAHRVVPVYLDPESGESTRYPLLGLHFLTVSDSRGLAGVAHELINMLSKVRGDKPVVDTDAQLKRRLVGTWEGIEEGIEEELKGTATFYVDGTLKLEVAIIGSTLKNLLTNIGLSVVRGLVGQWWIEDGRLKFRFTGYESPVLSAIVKVVAIVGDEELKEMEREMMDEIHELRLENDVLYIDDQKLRKIV